MVANLVHQNVGDDVAEGFLVLGPIIQDRPPVQPDHVGHQLWRRGLLEWQPDPLEQAQEVEFAVEVHGFQDLLGGEVLDPENQVLAKPPEVLRQPGIGLGGHNLDIGEGRGCQPSPDRWTLGFACHRQVLGQAGVLTKRLTELPEWATLTIKARMGTRMRSIGSSFVLVALIGAAIAVVATPAAAEFFGCNDKTSVRSYSGAARHSASARTTHEFAAQTSRPRITIYPRPRQLSANSVRQCRAQLVKEYRPSGTVIVPRMQCWWE